MQKRARPHARQIGTLPPYVQSSSAQLFSRLLHQRAALAVQTQCADSTGGRLRELSRPAEPRAACQEGQVSQISSKRFSLW